MKGSGRGRVVITSMVVVAIGAGLGSAQTSAQRAEGPVGCDPAVDLCLLDSAPWVSPEVIRYQGPAGVTDLEVRLRQGGKSSRADDIRVVSEDGLTKTWRATIPAGFKDKRLAIVATGEGVEVENRASGAVRSVVRETKLGILKDGGRRVAQLRFVSRGPVKVGMKLTLRAKYPAESTKRIKRWRSTETLARPGSRKVRLRTDNVEKRCKQFSECQLEARATVSSLGYRVGKESDRTGVPTPPERFQGSLGFVPGDASSGGGGRRYDYAVYVEDGIKIDRKEFASDIGKTLGDNRSWKRSGRVSFRQVRSASGADTRVILASPALVDRLCAPLNTNGYVSCTQGSSVILNLNRWRYAVPHFNSRLEYRRMLTNHEIGHRIGQGHRSCSGSGNRAPVMQQQTYGLQGCRANPWPLDYEAASARAAGPAKARAFGAGSRFGWLD